jgi:hypothetical protein
MRAGWPPTWEWALRMCFRWHDRWPPSARDKHRTQISHPLLVQLCHQGREGMSCGSSNARLPIPWYAPECACHSLDTLIHLSLMRLSRRCGKTRSGWPDVARPMTGGESNSAAARGNCSRGMPGFREPAPALPARSPTYGRLEAIQSSKVGRNRRNKVICYRAVWNVV